MSGYTQEPWLQSHRLKPGDGGMYDTEVYDAAGKTIAVCAWYQVPHVGGIGTSRGENARRIVACVNACAGISTEDLEESAMSILQHMEDQYGERLESLKQQHNELLAALKAVLKVSDETGEDDEYSPEWQSAIENMRAAIAKAEAN